MKKILPFIAILPLIVIGLYFIFTTSRYVRYWADDFCAGTIQHIYGLWSSQKYWWLSWSGRYSYNFTLHLSIIMGESFPKLLPIIIFSALVISSQKIFKEVLGCNTRNISLISACLFVLLVLINAPNIVQSFYWLTGALVYALPFLFVNLSLLMLAIAVKTKKGNKTLLPIVCAFLFSLIAGGFTEGVGLSLLVLFSIAIITTLIIDLQNIKSRVFIVALAALAGAAMSLLLMQLSPGVAARSTTVTRPESINFVMTQSLYGTKWYLQRLMLIKPFVLSVALWGSFIYIFSRKSKSYSKLARFETKHYIALIGLLLTGLILSVLVVIATGYYAMSITPPERAMFISIYMIFIYLSVIFYLFSVWLKSKASDTIKGIIHSFSMAVLLLTSVLLVVSIHGHWSRIKRELNAYAVEWDIQRKDIDIQIASGSKNITIINLKQVGELDGFLENKGWVSSCAAGYFKVDSFEMEE